MNENQSWNEESSAIFLAYADLFVPAREEQFASLISLLPARQDESFTVVELAAGAGVLAEAILERFPFCRYLALEPSQAMQGQMRQRLARFADRLEIRPFQMEELAWRATLPTPLRCVVSSLCVHHLTDEEKATLFKDLFSLLSPGGALLLADIVRPLTPLVAQHYAQEYDEIVRQQSLLQYGDESGFQRFCDERWNYFRYEYEDPASTDKPSLLSDQLRWLSEAGFTAVDCFWLRAGHAVFGGYKA
ncbi:ubiquinone/menaquinone biosynthesis C-methylase UbiE [Thermosporothrix hazakensis]|jgi:tRNA (cmo5U34)-methyltransferase|uniref:Ubiquinone/menaquinone biosynthesis C-methylase UbiE n=2 Tax=Thermosporothrix TaxID=768650 RepID=A0A326UEL3_THEHA|nr:class I SAM-dependent methyltransferase [Thermosporothrix hazakensis]PZW36291.1 ubiquinone/menaquinone biosynthesis C-methylase UbiE [Thermosporothrix hazakensis]BBH88757.1 hypothetical protein KTC_35080 [Thermosporothrix sp. COM3]GCE46941.1 hypothetical protein KTH_18100 [Thermosporothrix hazakensis]